MTQLTYIANSDSVHVRPWIAAARACGWSVRMETAIPPAERPPPGVEVETLTPTWLKRPSFLRYVWAGLKLRFRSRRPDEIVHAHCTSGNGLVAWLAGRSYIITTYGGEVLDAPNRGWYYYWTIRRVLRGAERITAASPQMVDILTQEHGIPRERIHYFDLGLELEVFRPADESQRRRRRDNLGIGHHEPIWISVKRAIPDNRTLEIVEAFVQHRRQTGSGRLILICGDNTVGGYVDRVKYFVAAAGQSENVIFLDRWMTQSDVAGWLQLADFAIAAPLFDQMSNAILESMACGCVPVLLSIGGYRSLRERGAAVCWFDHHDIPALRAVFDTTNRTTTDELRVLRAASVEFMREHYSNRKVGELLSHLYELAATEPAITRAA